MFLCNFLKCGNYCEYEQATERNMLLTLNNKSSALTTSKQSKKLNCSSLRHSRNLSFKKDDIRLKYSKGIGIQKQNQPNSILQPRYINSYQRDHSQLKIRNSSFIPTLMKQNDKKITYPLNRQRHTNNMEIGKTIQFTKRVGKPMSNASTNNPPSLLNQKISLCSIQTTARQTHSFLQQKNTAHRRYLSDIPSNLSSNLHSQSTERLQSFHGPSYPQECTTRLNNYILNIKKKEEKFNTFVIIENNQSSMSIHNETSNIVSMSKNKNLNVTFKCKENQIKPSPNPNALSSIKLIKQVIRKNKQAKKQPYSLENSQKQVQKQQRHNNIFKIVNTIKSIDQSVGSCQHSYLDLKFMNNLGSNKLFQKLM